MQLTSGIECQQCLMWLSGLLIKNSFYLQPIHGAIFHHWLKLSHPGALIVPLERTAGSRQDLAAKGATVVYWDRW